MRIAHVTSGLDRFAAGVGVVVSSLSAEQKSKGHEVRVFGPESAGWLSGDKDIWRGAPVESIGVVGWPNSFVYAPGLAKALERFDPEIVHLHGLWMHQGLAVMRWHQRTGIPYICSAHGMLSPSALSFSAIKKWAARVLFQDAVLTNATVMHAASETEAHDFHLLGLKNRIEIIPFGIEVTSVPAVQSEPLRRVLSLGRFHPKKGLDRLIKAWAQLEDQFPDWTLDLVGPDEGGHLAELQNLVSRLKLERVTMRPPVYGVERDACMAAAELFVLPTRGENFAFTVAESLMMQTPVISTDGAPWRGLVQEDCGWWIEQGVEPLISTLRVAMHLTDEERLALGKRGRAWMMRDYAWASVADQMLNVYQESITASKDIRLSAPS